MRLQRLSVLAGFTDPGVDPEELVATFHNWVRDRTLGGLPIDVARYNHVPDGPGTVLIGFEGDYAVDMSLGRPALRYTLKRQNEGSVAELVALAVGRLQQAAAQLADDTGHTVDLAQVVVRIADKLVAPNTEATRQRVQCDVVAAVAAALGLSDPEVSFGTLDPRDPVTIVVSGVGAPAA